MKLNILRTFVECFAGILNGKWDSEMQFMQIIGDSSDLKTNLGYKYLPMKPIAVSVSECMHACVCEYWCSVHVAGSVIHMEFFIQKPLKSMANDKMLNFLQNQIYILHIAHCAL